VAGQNNETICIWGLPGGQLIQELPCGRSIRGCAFLGSARPVLVCWTDKALLTWTQPAVGEGLDERQTADLIAQLGSAVYKDRQEATRRLIAAGPSVLPILRAAGGVDPEQAARIAYVQDQIAGQALYQKAGSVSLAGPGAFAAHPDGRHWGVITGEEEDRRIVLGEVVEGNPRIVRVFDTPHVPYSLAFDRSGLLIAGNGDGTLAVYDVLPAATRPAETQPAAGEQNPRRD
jgi:hypothetical protein